jgi:hypothetical protein
VPRLPRFSKIQQAVEDERKLAKIVGEAELRPSPTKAGGDTRGLRGVPCVSKGVRGVQPGSDPVAALLAKESRRVRRGR